jgi:hypothetical protein
MWSPLFPPRRLREVTEMGKIVLPLASVALAVLLAWGLSKTMPKTRESGNDEARDK